MARRKRKAVTRHSTRRRRRGTSARRRVYAANPGRKRRRVVHHRTSRGRRRYRRNPGMGGIVGQVVQLGVGAGGVLAGHAAFNFVDTQFGSTLVSATDTPTTGAAKLLAVGAALGIAITMVGRKLSGSARTFAEYAAVGAVAAPLSKLIIAMAPTSVTYLGSSMAMPSFPSMAPGQRRISAGGVQAYPQPDGMSAYPGNMY